MTEANHQLGEVERLIASSVEAMGFRLVQLSLTGNPDGGGGQPTLQVMAEPLGDDDEMNVDMCAQLSRAISAILDVEDPISSAYFLEVSSPGVDRPLVSVEDFQRYIGYQARVEAATPVNDRRRFVGRLLRADDEHVNISVTDSDESVKDFAIPFVSIARAKLVLTDDLIRQTLKKRKK
ncbi:MAG: ribosome maturation factor RimP [Alphaproteobacteria bacterium]|nr:ribosome maturation factor RimP [Alphaproteobacteria bacterium]